MQAFQSIRFHRGELTQLYFNSNFDDLLQAQNQKNTFILTDKNVHSQYANLWNGFACIVLDNAEKSKTLATIEYIIEQLLSMGADRDATLVGIGGGAITDIAGFVAGIYKRGIKNILVPTSILAMVDAAIGGKNGVNIGNYKNMAGLIVQPQAIWYDCRFLQSLPQEEWINGFAEVIKHAAIKDVDLWSTLQQNSLSYYQNNLTALTALIERNVSIKTSVVISDVSENYERKKLNFGHTLGHAIEHLYHLKHGQAIAIGMTFAAKLSEYLNDFSQTESLVQLLEQYHLPTSINYNAEKVIQNMFADKKAVNNDIHFILLRELGKADIVAIDKNKLARFLKEI